MFNTILSLEETATTFEGLVIHPVVCACCYQAMTQERRARSCPKSYAALANNESTFTVLDWKGIGTDSCRCCGSREKSERWSVMVVLKRKVA